MALVKDKAGWQGSVTFTKYKDGKIIEQATEHNIVTNYALNYMAQILTNSVAVTNEALVLPSYVELGIGTGTTSINDTDLFTPTTPRTIQNFSIMQVWLNTVAQYSSTWQSGLSTSVTWSEAGLKDVNGNLWAHVVINPIVVNSGEILTVQWQVQFVAVAD